jgi:hypothetical protein
MALFIQDSNENVKVYGIYPMAKRKRRFMIRTGLARRVLDGINVGRSRWELRHGK